VPKDKVSGAIGTEGTVRVQVFDQSGVQWAVLPTPSRDSIPVQEQDLTPA
jgi:hypothetical protein